MRNAIQYFDGTWLMPGSTARALWDEAQAPKTSVPDRGRIMKALRLHLGALDTAGRQRGEFPAPLMCKEDGLQPATCMCVPGQCRKALIRPADSKEAACEPSTTIA